VQLAPRSVRGTITLAFTAGAAVVLALCLTLLYRTLDHQFAVAFDADLSARAHVLASAVRDGDRAVLAADPLTQLYAPDGTVIDGSAALDGRRLLTPAEVGHVGSRSLRVLALPGADGGGFARVRVLSQRLADGQVLSVGVATGPLDDVRHRLLQVVVLAAPVLLAVLAFAGWLLVRATLRPVDVLTREAATISTLEPGRGLPVIKGDDEIARLAATLDDMLARLRVAFAREQAFVDDASHELRTPVAVVRGELELALASAGDPEEVERALRSALGEAERLSRLAEDLLLLARERTGSLVLRRDPVDLLDLAAGEADRLGRALGPAIEVSGDPVVIVGDGDRLRQVLGNLAANSAAAGATKARVHVTAERTAATVEFADDGPGFPPELVDRLFERFVRGDQSRTGSGAGLGLSIVRAVVAAHGGEVAVGNGPPLGGAVVTVRLPVR
jgi:two-component system, OmpR family, sensor kinase